ncbi:MAG: glycosyltransferase [Desulfobacterales bacterium]
MKIDMHVHSKHSHRPTQWVLQKINCPESFTEPLMIYQLARKKGMSHVTITDHNKISGALEIAHLPNAVVSEEITTYFPEDGCKIHVLAYDISESRHDDIQKLRSNIYELVSYLRHEGIFHAVAHPLYAVNNRFGAGHFEKLLILFNVFEQNGARSGELNDFLETFLKNLTSKDIEALADKHGLYPFGPTPWKKGMIGGSDDHSSLNIARYYTEVEPAGSVGNFFSGIAGGNAIIHRTDAHPKTLAHNLYGIAYQYYHHKFNLDNRLGRDFLLTFLNRTLQSGATRNGRVSKLAFLNRYRSRPNVKKIPESLKSIIQKETLDLILKDRKISSLIRGNIEQRKQLEKYWFEVVNQVSNNATHHLGNQTLNHLFNANVFKIFQSLGQIGGLYLLLSPYFIAFKQFAKDKTTNMQIIDHFPAISKRAGLARTPLRIAHFTDTFDEVNGVAVTLKQQVSEARRKNLGYTLLVCAEPLERPQKGIETFLPVGSYHLPEYPQIRIHYPPILEILDYCYRENITHIISATPGPMGIAAWIISRTLNITFSGTYHTAIPQYVQLLTGDSTMADLSWKYMIWYYDQMDRVQVPSESTKKELMEKGISGDKIDLINRGIDVNRFHPKYKNAVFQDCYGLPDNSVKLLYVGRISKEKNIDLLADVFISLCREFNNIHLIIAGDGPYLEVMKHKLEDFPCTFTGFLEGNDLASVFASSDMFVFPSTTDTFGNVVLEAQSSGIPVVVTDKGGPCENIIRNQTGFVAADNHDAFRRCIRILVKNAKKRREMGLAARKYMENRAFGKAFLENWEQIEKTTAWSPGISAGVS